MVTNNYSRISFLGERIKNKSASKPEQDEYMKLLYNDNLISIEQYNNYLKSNNTEDLVKAGLVIGAIALIAYLLGSTK
jgi:hypothetical protein